ncbi:MAG: hypothetical protein ACE5EF_02105, partial [Dehalococcoidia bacterium]
PTSAARATVTRSMAASTTTPAPTSGPTCSGGPAKGEPSWYVGRTAEGLLCLQWEDRWRAETGFEVHLSYPREPLERTYALPPDSSDFVIPFEDQPRLDESLELCLRRKDYVLAVTVLLPDSPEAVGEVAVVVECGGAGK